MAGRSPLHDRNSVVFCPFLHGPYNILHLRVARVPQHLHNITQCFPIKNNPTEATDM